MSNAGKQPVIALVLVSSLVTAITGCVFGVWAHYDVIPSMLDNKFKEVSCSVQSSEIISGSQRCACQDDGLSCTYIFPCVVIYVRINTAAEKSHMLYKDLKSYAFSSKCSFYPVGKMCRGSSDITSSQALLFKKQRGQVGSNFTCLVKDPQNPTIVVAERSQSHKAKFVVFVLNVVIFFLPLAFMNCFFLYKWRATTTYLGVSLKRKNRVGSMPTSAFTQRRDTVLTTAPLETD